MLDRLPPYGSSTIVRKREFGQDDLVAPTAATGDEFAMLTTGGRRMIVRGDLNSVPISLERARELGSQGWRFSAHVHPGRTPLQLEASDGDRGVLAAFGGERSVVFNSLGERNEFNQHATDMSNWVPR